MGAALKGGMNTYSMADGKLHKNSAGVALLIPQKDLHEIASLFLFEGEILTLRPADGSRWAKVIAYGVSGGNFRRLPIAVSAK